MYTLLSYHKEAYKYDYTRTIKRDGRTIDFDRAKIQTAIEKANKEVRGRGRVAYPCARFLGRPKKGGSTDEESKSLTFLDR